MDEAGRTAQPPLNMAPLSLEADPDGEVTDTAADNGIMSSSRTRSANSRSGVAQRTNGANGSSSAETAVPAAGPADSGPDRVDPGPAGDGAAAAASGRTAMFRPAAPPSAAVTTAEPALPPEPVSAPPAERAAPASPVTRSEPAYPDPSYPGSSSSYRGSSSAYPGSGPSYTAADSSYPGSAYATTTAPAGPGTGSAGSAPAGQPSSANGFTLGAASGAAAGLASSVTTAWHNRGSNGSKQSSPKAPKRKKPPRRQAMLTLARVEPWSVMKYSFVASVVAFIILFIAVAVLYMVLSALGVFDSLQHTVTSITSSENNSGTNISHWFSASLILGYTAMLGALNIVLITAISTVGSVIYNLIAKTVGGIEVTLRETD